MNSKEDLLVDVFKIDVGHAWEEAFELADPDAPLLDQLLTAYLHVTRHHEGHLSRGNLGHHDDPRRATGIR